MTNKPDGTLYIGVTRYIARRAWEHGSGLGSGFTRKYNLQRLVYMEVHEDVQTAIQREKTMKEWKRDWKVALIEKDNPEWADLYDRLNG